MTLSRRRQPADQPDLSPATVSVLLLGWCAPEPPEPSPHGFAHGYLELYDCVHGREVGIVRMWQRYEGFLRTTARRWGWDPPYQLSDGRHVFYGELAALSEADQAACVDARDHGDEENV